MPVNKPQCRQDGRHRRTLQQSAIMQCNRTPTRIPTLPSNCASSEVSRRPRQNPLPSCTHTRIHARTKPRAHARTQPRMQHTLVSHSWKRYFLRAPRAYGKYGKYEGPTGWCGLIWSVACVCVCARVMPATLHAEVWPGMMMMPRPSKQAHGRTYGQHACACDWYHGAHTDERHRSCTRGGRHNTTTASIHPSIHPSIYPSCLLYTSPSPRDRG